MQFITFLTIVLFTAFAAAQNPFNFVSLPQSIPVGTPFNITWSPSTGTVDTVSLVLRQGDATNLAIIQTIACMSPLTSLTPNHPPSMTDKLPSIAKIQNTGSYLWTPASSLANGPLYAFQIVDDGNINIVNYSGQFAISSSSSQSEAGSTATGTNTKSHAASSTQTKPGSSATAGASVSSFNTGSASILRVGCGGMLVVVAGVMIAL